LGIVSVFISMIVFSCSGNESNRQPNILFIFSDDHGYQAISAYGGRLAKLAPTPNIDKIARDGMLFERCYVTNSICAPSRATVLTGKHSHLNTVKTNADVFDSTQQTFPKLLQQAGYQTALVGKWHLKSNPTGFDYWEVLPGQGNYYNPDFITAQGRITVSGYVTDIITDKALNWLETGRDKSKPFLLMLQNKAPHREWEPGPEHLTLYKDVTFPEPDNLFDDYSGRGTAAMTQDMTIDKTMRLDSDLKIWLDKEGRAFQRTYGRMNETQRAAWDAAYDPLIAWYRNADLRGAELVRWKYQRYMQDYLATIRSVDDNVGRVLDYLDKSGLAENTIIVYTSDQGFYLGEHGWFDKRFMYEESFKTPLMVRWPARVPPGTKNDDLVSNLDFAPTFLDIAGLPVPPDMQGVSLLPLLQMKKPAAWRNSLYYHYYEFPGAHMVRRHEGVVTGQFKLLFFYDLDEWELYDRLKDSSEMHSVYNDITYADTVAALKAELIRLRSIYKVPPNQPLQSKN
jgi:arylsulfatase A-like enzyme